MVVVELEPSTSNNFEDDGSSDSDGSSSDSSGGGGGGGGGGKKGGQQQLSRRRVRQVLAIVEAKSNANDLGRAFTHMQETVAFLTGGLEEGGFSKEDWRTKQFPRGEFAEAAARGKVGHEELATGVFYEFPADAFRLFSRTEVEGLDEEEEEEEAAGASGVAELTTTTTTKAILHVAPLPPHPPSPPPSPILRLRRRRLRPPPNEPTGTPCSRKFPPAKTERRKTGGQMVEKQLLWKSNLID